MSGLSAEHMSGVPPQHRAGLSNEAHVWSLNRAHVLCHINSRLKGAVDRELGGKYIYKNKSQFSFFDIFAEKLIF